MDKTIIQGKGWVKQSFDKRDGQNNHSMRDETIIRGALWTINGK